MKIIKTSPPITFPARWEDFLKALTNRLSKTTPSLLNVRCLTESTLSHLFEIIRTDLGLPTTFPSGVKILDHLTSMGLSTQIPVEVVCPAKPSNRFFLLGIHRSQEINIDPLELLQAYHQSGVICYFSALSHLGMTSQIAAHHHIAMLTTRPNKATIERAEKTLKLNKPSVKAKRSKIGTPAFSYQRIPYYSTKRTKRSAPGIKTRMLSPLANIRMTTKEQTLLDTLQYPYHCGGPEAVFEAWENRINSLDEDLLLDYLKKIQIAPLTRRLGAIFHLYDHHPIDKLGSFINSSRDRFIATSEFKVIGLLRGIEYSQLDSFWNVAVP